MSARQAVPAAARVPRTTTRRTNNSAGPMPYIAAREPFRTGAALCGRAWRETGRHGWECGLLPHRFRNSFYAATYAVFSYETPIAWLTDGVWVIPNVSYSATTGGHQASALWGARESGLPIAGDDPVRRVNYAAVTA